MFVDHAHSAIICGATGSGKTEYTLDLLQKEHKGFLKYIVIICPTWRYNKAYLSRKWLFEDPQHVFLVDPGELLPKSADPLNDALKMFLNVSVN